MPAVLTREQAPSDTEQSTAQTVAKMAEHIRNSAGDPAVVWAAGQARKSAGPGASKSALAKAVFYLIKCRVRFRTDDELISLMFNKRDELELLISPPVLLRSQQPVGDCDDFTMLCCAMLHELGIKSEIITVKADQPDPSRWSHVYCCAETEQGPMIMDTSHGDFPGWEVPFYYAKRTWDSRTGQALHSEGGRVPEPRRRAAGGLHGYTRTGMGAVRRRRRGMFGLGDDTVDLSTLPDMSTGDTSLIDYTNTGGGSSYLLDSPLSGVSSSPSALGTAFAANLSNIINQGFKTLQLSLVPTGGVLVQGANGQYTISNNAGAVSNLSTSGMSMTTLLLIGGAVLVVAMVAGKK